MMWIKSISKIEWHLTAFFLGCLTLCFAGHATSVDENLIVQVVDSIVNHGNLTVSNMFQALEGPDGNFYSRYGFVFPLLLVPFFYVGKVLQWIAPQSPVYCGNLFMFVLLWTSVFCTALVGWLLFRICRLLGGRESTGTMIAVSCILCTPFLPYSQSLYRLTASTVVLLSALYLILLHQRFPKHRHLAGLILLTALGINLREDLIVGLFWLGCYCIIEGNWKHRIARGGSMIAGVVLGAILWGIHNYIRFDAFYIQNYADVKLNYPLIMSLPPLTYGLRRGIFVYAPIALLWPVSLAWLKEKPWIKISAICSAMLVSYLLLYAKSDFWHGGICWGPRHMYFLLPFAMIPMIPFLDTKPLRWKMAAFIILSLLGLFMNWPGVYAHAGKYQSFFEAPSFFTLLMRPVTSPDYVGFDDLDLWWIRAIKLEPVSLWPLLFMLCLAFTIYQGYYLAKSIRQNEDT